MAESEISYKAGKNDNRGKGQAAGGRAACHPEPEDYRDERA